MAEVIDMTGQTHGRLTVLQHVGRIGKSRNHKWQCRCQCGSLFVASGASIRAGTTRSCGCLQRELATLNGNRAKTHGQSNSSLYAIWDSMHQRCNNPKRKDFANYGAKGVAVCDRWKSFEAFALDMGDRPKGHSIDRIDPAGNYEPSNCRWASATQQARNTSKNRKLEWQGKALCVAEWAQLLGINSATLEARLTRGWSVERALSTPVQKKGAANA